MPLRISVRVSSQFDFRFEGTMLREALVKLAETHPEFRKHIVPLLREAASVDRVGSIRVAREFDNKKQLDIYLKDHPGADRKRHTVKDKKDDGAKKEDAPASGKGKAITPEEAKKKVEQLKLPDDVRQRLNDYHLDVVGDDLDQAIDIAKKVTEGIDKAADVCKLSPPVCKGNLGLTRDKMPQIPGDMSVKEMLAAKNKDGTPDEETRAKGKAAVEAGADPDDDRSVLRSMLDTFRQRGVKIEPKKIPVGKLKATQSEIKAKKTFEMADSHLKGKFPSIGDQIVVSKDGHILDGHHRWAALLTIDPGRVMSCIQVDMTMKEMLDEADGMAGVYREDFQGKPLPMSDEIKKRKEKAKSKGGKK